MASTRIVSQDEPAEPAAAVSGEVRSRVRATLRLDFQKRDDTHRGAITFLKSSLQEPPLRVVRAFDRPDGSALVHLHNVSGGLLGGDQLALEVNVEAGARVQMTTTGATRIYRPRASAAPVVQTTRIILERDALLEYVPDQVIPFAGARYAQNTQIHLAEGAGLFWWEVVAPGREASGEIFAYDRLEISAELIAKGRPIAVERVKLAPGSRRVDSFARLGRYRTWATFYICRVGMKATSWIDLEQHLRDVARRLTHTGDTLWGISTLVRHGLAIRGITTRGADLLPGLHAFWREAKLKLYGCEPVPPRKVN